MTQEPRPDGPPAVGARLQVLRQSHKLTLDELSRRAGVSKSMLSQIERNQANPTVAVVWRLANALAVDLAELLSEEPARADTPAITLVADHATPVIRSTDGKCELRILGPIELAGRLEWYKLSIESGGVLASEAHERGAREHLTVLSGQVLVKAAGAQQKVVHGETARYQVDVHHALSNPGKTAATALLVVEYAQ